MSSSLRSVHDTPDHTPDLSSSRRVRAKPIERRRQLQWTTSGHVDSSPAHRPVTAYPRSEEVGPGGWHPRPYTSSGARHVATFSTDDKRRSRSDEDLGRDVSYTSSRTHEVGPGGWQQRPSTSSRRASRGGGSDTRRILSDEDVDRDMSPDWHRSPPGALPGAVYDGSPEDEEMERSQRERRYRSPEVVPAVTG